MASKAQVNYRFQYIGDEPVESGLERVDGKPGDLLYPNDEVVVHDVGVAGWLRSLGNFREVSSPTSDKATHKAAKPKRSRRKAAHKAAHKAEEAPKPAPEGDEGESPTDQPEPAETAPEPAPEGKDEATKPAPAKPKPKAPAKPKEAS